MLVDDPLEQLGFFHSDHFEVRCELVLDFDKGDVAISVSVELVETFLDCEVEICCKTFAKVFSHSI